jgi:hypothetical protein
MTKLDKRQNLPTQNVKMLLHGLALCQQCLKAFVNNALLQHLVTQICLHFKLLTIDLQCSVQKAEAMQREMESKQQLYSSLQRQLDGLQQDLQTKQAHIDQRLAAAAKQAEERHGQLYHTYMKRALVDLYCHRRLAVAFKQSCLMNMSDVWWSCYALLFQNCCPSSLYLADLLMH